MSYCRFSSNNFTSDVYVFDDWMFECYTVHVASRRLIIPPIPHIPFDLCTLFADGSDKETKRLTYSTTCRKILGWVWHKLFWLSYKLHMWSVGIIPRRRIGLERDGACLRYETPGDCAEGLQRLAAMGYNVPDSAVEALLEEEKENQDD